jgi:hypothetical protein
MKKILIAGVCILLVACNSKKDLSKGEAQLLIEKHFQQKGPLSVTMELANEEYQAKLKDTKLVKDGYITFIPGLSWMDVDKPHIKFEEKAAPYKLPPESGSDIVGV